MRWARTSSACCLPAACRGGWAAGTRPCGRSGGDGSVVGVSAWGVSGATFVDSGASSNSGNGSRWGGWNGSRLGGSSSRIQGDSSEQPQRCAVTCPAVRAVLPHFAHRQMLRTSKLILRPGPFTGIDLSVERHLDVNFAAALTCTANPKAASSGVDTFAGCKINLAGTGYRLHATASGLGA